MLLEKELVRKIGTVDVSDVANLVNILQQDYFSHWVKRTLKVMESSLVLKALSPTNLDRCNDSDKLLQDCLPLISQFIGPNEKLVYLDVSCLPKGAQMMAHFDYGWIHVLSKRVTIPLITNQRSIFAALDEDNKIQTYNMKVGGAYEINNQTLHTAANFGEEDRWHMLADVIDVTAYEYLLKSQKLDKPYCNKWCNFYFNQKIKDRFEEALKSPPTIQI